MARRARALFPPLFPFLPWPLAQSLCSSATELLQPCLRSMLGALELVRLLPLSFEHICLGLAAFPFPPP